MTLSRRSFFAKVAGVVVAARVAPPPGRLAAAVARLTGKSVYAYSGGAHIGSIAGSVIDDSHVHQSREVFDRIQAAKVTFTLDGKELAKAIAPYPAVLRRQGP